MIRWPLPGVAGLLPDGLLPDGLPDEATLNRLAGEFFAALPGLPAGSGRPAAGSVGPAAVTPGAVEHASRVDVPPAGTGVTRTPGSSGGDGPGIDQTDPVAALGVSPTGSVPDLTQVTDSLSSAAGVGGLPAPENLVIQGITGLELAGPGELTPGIPGLSSPLPSAGLPGIPASDQVVQGIGLPGGSPDPTMVNSAATAVPTAGPPDLPAMPVVDGEGGFAAPPVPGTMIPVGTRLPSASPDLTGGQLPGATVPGGSPAGLSPAAAAVPFAVPDTGLATPEMPAVPEVRGTPGAPGIPESLGVPESPGIPESPGLAEHGRPPVRARVAVRARLADRA